MIRVAHGVSRVSGIDRYEYDGNGNVTVRNKGLSSRQTLVWNPENRLSSVEDLSGDMIERYLYDDTGARVRKERGNTTWYYPFPHYEVKVVSATTQPTPSPTNTLPPTPVPTNTPTQEATATSTVAPQATATPEPTVTPTSTSILPSSTSPPIAGSACLNSGPIVLYRFEEGTGSVVTDTSGRGIPLDLSIAGEKSWQTDGGLKIDGPSIIISSGPAGKVIDAVKSANAISAEMWVKPVNITQSGPARMVSISQDAFERNFTLGQDATEYEGRLRTTATDLNGRNPSTVTGTGAAGAALQHVVYIRDNSGAVDIYVNGILVESNSVGGSMENWDHGYRLVLANEADGSRPWLGELHRTAIYACALTSNDVSTLESMGAHGGSNPPPAPTVTNTPVPQATTTGTPVVLTPTPTPTSTPIPVGDGCNSPAGNLIANPGFEEGKAGWKFANNGSAGFSVTEDGPCGQAANVAVSSAGSNTQLYQSGVELETGVQYRLRFDARSASGSDVIVFIHRHQSPYTNYGLNAAGVDLTPSWQSFELTFTAKNVTSANGRLRIKFTGTDDFYFDNVSLVPTDASASALSSQMVYAVYLPQLINGSPAMATETLLFDDPSVPRDDGGHNEWPDGVAAGEEIANEEWADNPVGSAAVDGWTISVRKYYFFGGQRIAVWTDEAGSGSFRYLHGDHLGSTVLETGRDGGIAHDRGYGLYGSYRDTDPADGKQDNHVTDNRFTGQKEDGTGLIYFNARYYDPQIGQFVSPDTVVPGPENLFDYNRYMYARGNPMKYIDPSGHIAICFRGGSESRPKQG